MSFKEISGAQQMMRLAINGQRNIDSLIGYYRDLIDQFNSQRAQWAIHYQHLKANATDNYLLQKQIKSTDIKIKQLQHNLAQSKAQLTLERQKYFRMCQQSRLMKERLDNTKKELREVTSQCKPIHFQTAKSLNKDYLISGKDSGNSKITQLQLELININKNHQAKKQVYIKQIQQLKGQLNQLTQQHQSRDHNSGKQYFEALNRLSELQTKNINLTIDFFKFRMENSQQQQKIQQKSQIYRLKNIALAQKLNSLKQSHNKQFESVSKQVKKRNIQFQKQYDQQLKKKQDHLKLLKDQYQRIQEIHLQKIKNLEQQLKIYSSKISTTEEKAKTQIINLKSQIKILTKRLEKDGITHMRSQLAEDQQDQESSDSLQVSQMEKINKEVRNLQRQLKLQ